jgi:release factor glutamine methyltransferase
MNTNASLSTTSQWLAQATKQLEAAGIGTARLDCLILLEDAAGFDRSHLLAHPDTLLSSRLLTKLSEQLTRRQSHEPLAYIRGKTEFYGREFIITPEVLEPRPESETMIDLLKSAISQKSPFPPLKKDGPFTEKENVQWRIIDVGTGSGALAITAKLELLEMEISAIDIDEKCLEVARKNAKKLGASVVFYQGNLLEPVPALSTRPVALLCNLPYVPDDYHINDAAMMEPRIAIFGGPDGLDLYRQLFAQIRSMAVKPSLVLTESLPSQHEMLQAITETSGYIQIKDEGFIQAFAIG